MRNQPLSFNEDSFLARQKPVKKNVEILEILDLCKRLAEPVKKRVCLKD